MLGKKEKRRGGRRGVELEKHRTGPGSNDPPSFLPVAHLISLTCEPVSGHGRVNTCMRTYIRVAETIDQALLQIEKCLAFSNPRTQQGGGARAGIG